MRKITLLAIIIGIGLISCKKDDKVSNNEIIGTWTLYSHAVVTNNDTTFKALATQYPCMSNIKFIFHTDGTYEFPYFSPCYITPEGDFGTGSDISHVTNTHLTWFASGNTIYTSRLDSVTKTTIQATWVVSNINGKPVMTNTEPVNGASIATVYVKEQ
jgi:hypothetical protein